MSDPAAILPLPPPPPPPTAAAAASREYNKGNWTVAETLTLISAKRLDDERRARGDRPAGAAGRPSEQRWKWVENYCWCHGCLRSQNQCNDKWDNLLRDYKKVVGYESRGGGASYWALERQERKERNLPTNLAAEVFEALSDVLGRRSARRGTVVAPLTLLLPTVEVKEETPPAVTAPPAPAEDQAAAAAQASVSVENLSESTEDTDVDASYDNTNRRRKLRRLSSSIVRGASALAQALLSCEDRRERRHRERMEMEERRLRLEAEKVEMGRQGIAGIIDVVRGLAGVAHAVAGDDRRRSGGGAAS